MILIRCSCGRKLRVRAEHAGRTGRCPKCGRDIQVPDDVLARAAEEEDEDEEPESASPRGAGSGGEVRTAAAALGGRGQGARPAPAASAQAVALPSDSSDDESFDGGDTLVGEDEGEQTARMPMRPGSEAPTQSERRAFEPDDAPLSGLAAPSKRGLLDTGSSDSDDLHDTDDSEEPLHDTDDSEEEAPDDPRPPQRISRQLSTADTPKDPAAPPAHSLRQYKAAQAARERLRQSKAARPPKGDRTPRKAVAAEKTRPFAAAAPTPAGARTMPLRRAVDDGSGADERPAAAQRTVPLVSVPAGPWYENEAFVLLLLVLCFPAGVAGVLMDRSWTTGAQRGVVAFTALSLVGCVAALALLV